MARRLLRASTHAGLPDFRQERPMVRDLRYAVRALLRSRVFTVSATLALGLAVGANATIFGLVDGLWLRPPGIPHAGELTRIFAVTDTTDSGGWSFPDYRDLQGASAFSGVVARGQRGVTLRTGDAPPDVILVNVVSMNFFTVLGVQAAHGRLFGPDDESALEAEPGVVLGHAFWRRRYGADPSIVGRTIALGSTGQVPVTVLGVLPRTFRDLEAAADRDLWLPPTTWARLAGPDEFADRDHRWFGVIARLKGATVTAAQDEVSALAAAMAREHPGAGAGRGVRVVPDLEHRLERGGDGAAALLGLVLLVILITCVNLANLMLARAAGRTQEIATRVALGAGRWRVMRQMMAEALVLGALGTFVGLTIGMWLIQLLPAILVPPPGFSQMADFRMDARVLAFTLAVALLTTLLFGLVPSWIAARGDIAPLIKGAATLAGSRRTDRLARQGMLVAQIAVSLVLLSSAGLLTRSFMATGTAEIGFARKPILTAWGTLDVPPATAAEGIRALEAVPGVSNVAIAIRAPLSLSGGGLAQPIWVPNAPPGEALPEVKFNAVSANYFAALGTRLVDGRDFTTADERPGEPVMVVNRAFVDRFFPNGEAIDRIVRLRGVDGIPHRVIGVVENGVVAEIDDKNAPYFYLPYWRGSYGDITFLVETAGAPGGWAAGVRSTLKAVHPALEPRRIVAMADYIEFSSSVYRATATLALLLGLLGLVLTAVGVYGVVAYRTTERTREIGLRVALGANPAGILGLVFKDGMRTAALGVGFGVPAALWAARFLEPLLFEVGPGDLTAYAIAAAALTAAVALATFVPARRATRVSPIEALRAE
jgi:predicted permease